MIAPNFENSNDYRNVFQVTDLNTWVRLMESIPVIFLVFRILIYVTNTMLPLNENI